MSVEAADPTACAAPHVRGLQVAGAWWQNNYMVVPGESFGSAQGIPCQNEAVTYSLWVNPATGWQSGSTYGLGVLCRLLRHCNDGYEWWEMNNSESLFIQKDSDGNPKIVFGVGVTVTEATSAAYTLPSTFDGNWHFIAATYAARVLTLYYDGEKVAEQTLTADVNLADNSPLIIGAKCDDFNFYCSDRYAGRLDDVRVYNRALTADEVRDVYAAGATAFDTDVIAWTGAAEGGAAAETANWASASNRRTAGEIYAEGAVLDVSSLADGGVLTHETADAALKVKGVVCTNGQQEVTLHVKAGALELDRPSTQRGLVAHLSFDDPNDRLLDSGTAGLIAASGAWAHNGTADTALPIASVEGVSGNAMEFPASSEWRYWPSTYVKTDAAATTRANGIPAGGETVAYSLWIRPYGLGAWNNGMLGLGDDAIWVFRRGNYGNGFSTYLFLAKGSGGDSSAKLIWSIANWMEDGGTCTYETDDLFDGTWHHVACVYEERKAATTTRTVAATWADSTSSRSSMSR